MDDPDPVRRRANADADHTGVGFRVTLAEHLRITRAAEAAGLALPEWLRRLALNAASRLKPEQKDGE
mgnify:CR=1 FL=1